MTLSVRDGLADVGAEARDGVAGLAAEFGLPRPTSVRDLLAFTRENAAGTRPFWVIAHRCNSADAVREQVGRGANAIECDVRPTGHAAEFVVNHDWDRNPERDALVPYLRRVAAIAQEHPRLALVIFDCKDAASIDSVRLRTLVRRHLTDVVPVHVLFSVAEFAHRSFFVPLAADVRPGEGCAIDEHDDPVAVESFFTGLGIARQGYGFGHFAYGIKPVVHDTVMFATARRWSRRRLRMSYVWTLEAKSSMRDYLHMGVDGIFVNDAAELRAVLREEPFDDRVRLARRADDPFAPPHRRAYVLRVVTGDRDSAGTDAHVTFALHGTRGVAQTTIDAQPAGLFERGQVNHLAIVGRHVGRLERVVVRIDDAGNAPGWFLQSLRVRATGADDAHELDVRRWLEPGEPLTLEVG